jgi:diguanylate cyclase (GGDEF)-like protein
VLRNLGLLLRTVGRTQDMPARVGGEEFALLLPDTDTAGAQAMADKVMQALAQLELPHAASPTAHRVSVSVGVVTWAQSGSGGAVALLAQADKALYAAKHGGRMRACVYGTPEVPRL